MAEQGRPAGAGEFGTAVIADVLTPAMVRRQAQAVLDTLVERRDAWPEQLPAPVAPTVRSVRPAGDDGSERRFAVVVDMRAEARFGRYTFGAGSTLRATATVRVQAHRPAVLRIRIDPLTPDDLRWHRPASTGPGSLTAGLGGALMELTELGESVIPLLTTAINTALEVTARHRDVDVPDLIHRALTGSGAAATGATEHPAARPAARPAEPRPAGRSAAAPSPAGERIDFAEFGAEVLRLGVDVATVRHVLAARLDDGPPIPVRRPPVVDGTATPRLADVGSLPPEGEALRFAITLDIDLDLRLGGARGLRLRRAVSARTVLRVTPQVRPAGLLVTLDPFAPEDVGLPVPEGGRASRVHRLAARVVPGLVARRLNDQLPEPQRFVAAELAGSAPAGPGSDSGPGSAPAGPGSAPAGPGSDSGPGSAPAGPGSDSGSDSGPESTHDRGRPRVTDDGPDRAHRGEVDVMADERDTDTTQQLAEELGLTDEKMTDMSQDELDDAAAKLKKVESVLDEAEHKQK